MYFQLRMINIDILGTNYNVPVKKNDFQHVFIKRLLTQLQNDCK